LHGTNSINAGWIDAAIARDTEVAAVTNNALWAWAAITSNTVLDRITQVTNTTAITNGLATTAAMQNVTNNALWAWATVTSNTVLDRITQVTNTTAITNGLATTAALQNVTNNSLWAWSTITTNTTLDRITATTNTTELLRTWVGQYGDLALSNLVTYGLTGYTNSLATQIYADNRTNNGALARTNVAQTLYTKTLHAPMYYTNAADNGATIDITKTYQYTNAAGAITFSGVTGTDPSRIMHTTLFIDANGSDRTITVPASWKNHGNTTAHYVTNGWQGVLSLVVYGGQFTNMAFHLVKW